MDPEKVSDEFVLNICQCFKNGHAGVQADYKSECAVRLTCVYKNKPAPSFGVIVIVQY
jgi:hypothetical protein